MTVRRAGRSTRRKAEGGEVPLRRRDRCAEKTRRFRGGETVELRMTTADADRGSISSSSLMSVPSSTASSGLWSVDDMAASVRT
jgi:transcriptional regulator NrdR family protein